jgi:hypothetical protein
MRRTAFTLLACATVALAGTAAPAAAQKAGPRATVTMPVCHSAVAPLDRGITWVGDMFSLRAGNRMEMRFDVYTRTPGDPVWRLVKAPDLGIWNRAKADRSEYKFLQKAVNLAAPASYKARVTFRWLGPNGQKTVKRLDSKVCEQRDARPNLRVTRLDGAVVNRQLADYIVVVRNVGQTAVSSGQGFDVGLAVDGIAQPTQTFTGGLRPGERVQFKFRAPRCKQGGTFKGTVDPDARIDQSDRADDTLELPCPASLA